MQLSKKFFKNEQKRRKESFQKIEKRGNKNSKLKMRVCKNFQENREENRGKFERDRKERSFQKILKKEKSNKNESFPKVSKGDKILNFL